MIRWMTMLALAAACLAQQKKDPGSARDLITTRIDESIDAPAAGKVSVPRSYALVVGVSQYQHLSPKEQLMYPAEDAEAVYSILISREGGNFGAENVHKLVGAKATLGNIRKELEQWLPSVTRENDRVLVYFAGHGFVYQGKVYLAPSDFDKHNIAGTGYSTDELGAAFGSKIKGKWKVLLTDSCHSGAVASDTESQTINTRLKDLSRSLFTLTASRDRERSFESKDWGGGHGIFTYYVVKGMEGEADESGDGTVTADELAVYVQREVRQATNGQQNPTAGGSFDNQMLLAYNPTRAKRGTPPPPQTGTLIFESNRDGVEVFVDGQSQGVVQKGGTLRVPGLKPGIHTVRGVHMGYEPVGPREEMVYPGQEATIKLQLSIPRRRPRAAVDKFGPAVERYLKSRGPEQYRRAVSDFEEILAIDATYSEAALYAGRACRDLRDFDKAAGYLRKALDIDPDFVEARATYGGMLFDKGDIDEAVRQLNQVLRRDRDHALAYYLLAQAYRIKEQYTEAVDAAGNAVRLSPANAEAHFWLAEGLRGLKKWTQAADEYAQYLKLSNFDSSAIERFGYYAIGFKFFRKRRAGTQDVWKSLRSLAYFGLCDAENRMHRYDSAISSCQRALSFDPNDPLAHYALGLGYMKQADAVGDIGLLPAARRHFAQSLSLNPDLDEAAYARKNISIIDHFLRQQ
jgi:tetratricopeptide (TPR) repeat protein